VIGRGLCSHCASVYETSPGNDTGDSFRGRAFQTRLSRLECTQPFATGLYGITSPRRNVRPFR